MAVTPAGLRALDAIRPEDAAPADRVFRLSVRQMGNRLKAACRAAGLEGDGFSGHSGRVGLARMMSGAGAPTEITMRQGRWKSAEMVRRYTRGESAGRRPAVDGRGDGNRTIELVGQGEIVCPEGEIREEPGFHPDSGSAAKIPPS